MFVLLFLTVNTLPRSAQYLLRKSVFLGGTTRLPSVFCLAFFRFGGKELGCRPERVAVEENFETLLGGKFAELVAGARVL